MRVLELYTHFGDNLVSDYTLNYTIQRHLLAHILYSGLIAVDHKDPYNTCPQPKQHYNDIAWGCQTDFVSTKDCTISQILSTSFPIPLVGGDYAMRGFSQHECSDLDASSCKTTLTLLPM